MLKKTLLSISYNNTKFLQCREVDLLLGKSTQNWPVPTPTYKFNVGARFFLFTLSITRLNQSGSHSPVVIAVETHLHLSGLRIFRDWRIEWSWDTYQDNRGYIAIGKGLYLKPYRKGTGYRVLQALERKLENLLWRPLTNYDIIQSSLFSRRFYEERITNYPLLIINYELKWGAPWNFSCCSWDEKEMWIEMSLRDVYFLRRKRCNPDRFRHVWKSIFLRTMTYTGG